MGQLLLSDLLADVAEGVPPIDAGVVDGALSQARHRRTVRWIAGPAAVAVIAVAGALVGLPHLRNEGLQTASPGDAGPAVPSRLADYSYLTAPVTDAPAGRAVAVLSYYKMDQLRTVVLSADRDSYRLVEPEVAKDAEYNSAVLSPDGTVAALQRGAGRVDMLDLRSGKIRQLHLADATAESAVFGFSPDGRTLVAGTHPFFSDGGAVPYLVDVSTGAATRLVERKVYEVAFSPDGQKVALGEKGHLTIADRTGRTLRTIETAEQEYGGTNSWSPDGRFVVTLKVPGDGRRPSKLRFHATDDAIPAADVPATQDVVGLSSVLGWKSADQLVVQESSGGGNSVVVRGVRDGSREVLAKGAGHVDGVAAGLLPSLGSRAAEEPDFGPWPSWLLGLLVVGVLLLAFVSVVLVWVGKWAVRVNRRPFPDAPAPPDEPR